jgi:arylsulfatase A-like enzyme
MAMGARVRRPIGPATVGGCLLAVALGLEAGPAWGRCGTEGELRAFHRGVSAALLCARARLRGGGSLACARDVTPPCAGDAVTAITEVVFGQALEAPRARRAPDHAMRCQRALATASRRFVVRRVGERTAGSRRQDLSLRSFRTLADACRVTVTAMAGIVLPSLGGACGSSVGAPGSTVEPERLVGCLRPALEAIVDGVVPEALRPNVLVVLTDDQRWDTLGYMPGVLDRLARRGVRFTEAFATTPLCAPSRASILTGRYAHHTGVTGNFFPGGGARAFDPTSTIATWLQAAGYRTGLFGKYLNGYDALAPAVPPGWDAWHAFAGDGRAFYGYTLAENGALSVYGTDEASYSTDVLRHRALAFLRAEAEGPWFILYAPYAPHHGGIPAPRHEGAHATLPPRRPPSFWDDVSRKPSWVRYWAAFFRRPEVVAQGDARVRGEVESLLAVDEGVEALLAAAAELGLEDNTVVVFTSDHGLLWGEHGWTGKECAYEEGIRTPLVIRYPLLAPAPAVRDEIVLNLDLAPTLADLAGAPVPAAIDGRSVRDLLAGAPSLPWRDDFLVENWTGFVPASLAVRTRRWKYIETVQGTTTFTELYDLLADPYEMTNLAGGSTHAAVQAALAARLVALAER